MTFPSVKDQWLPGQSGNPQGRPRKVPIHEHIERMVRRDGLEGLTAEKIQEAFAKVAIVRGMQGHPLFWKIVVDFIDSPLADIIAGDGHVRFDDSVTEREFNELMCDADTEALVAEFANKMTNLNRTKRIASKATPKRGNNGNGKLGGPGGNGSD